MASIDDDVDSLRPGPDFSPKPKGAPADKPAAPASSPPGDTLGLSDGAGTLSDASVSSYVGAPDVRTEPDGPIARDKADDPPHDDRPARSADGDPPSPAATDEAGATGQLTPSRTAAPDSGRPRKGKAKRQPTSRASPKSRQVKRAPLYVCVKVGDANGAEPTSDESEWRTTLEVRAGATSQTASSPFPDKQLVFEIPGDARESGALVITLFEVVDGAETLVGRGKFKLASPPYRGRFALRRSPERPAQTRSPVRPVTWWEHRQEADASRLSVEIDVQVLPHRPQRKPRSSQERVSDRILMSRDNPNRILENARRRAEKTYEKVLASCDFIRNFQATKDLSDVSDLRENIRKVQQQIDRTQKEIEQLEQEIPALEAEGQADE